MATAKKKTASASPKSAPKAKAVKATTRPAPKAKASTPGKTPVRTTMMSRLAAGPSSAALPARLQLLVDKDDIATVLYDVARGLDRLDETLLRSAFHPDATIDMGPGMFQGTGSDYVHWILGALNQTRETHHMIGNIRVTLEGDAALVETYCHAHFRLDKPTGREDVFMGSRYLDRFERRPSGPSGAWKIVHRKQIMDWVRTEAVSDIFYHQNPDALWSYRTKTDPSYQMSQFPGSQPGSKLPSFLGRRYESKSVKF